MTFPCMGGDVRLLVEDDGADPRSLACAARGLLDDLDARLSRFAPDSELCALNADPRATVPVSPLLLRWLAAAVGAARRTGGLVDPTLLAPLEHAGYRRSRRGATAVDLGAALVDAPLRRPARPAEAARWRDVVLDEQRGTVTRPPGLRLDSGGTGKGLAADLAAHLLRGADRFAVDCAGDIAVGGTAGRPYAVGIEHPLTGDVTHTASIARGGIATSGIDRNLWRRDDGTPGHHLLDPSTGEPAWTGLISATVLASSVVAAETLAKAALLSGPAGARRLLRGHHGVLTHEDGDVEVLTAAADRTRLHLRVAA